MLKIKLKKLKINAYIIIIIISKFSYLQNYF